MRMYPGRTDSKGALPEPNLGATGGQHSRNCERLSFGIQTALADLQGRRTWTGFTTAQIMGPRDTLGTRQEAYLWTNLLSPRKS